MWRLSVNKVHVVEVLHLLEGHGSELAETLCPGFFLFLVVLDDFVKVVSEDLSSLFSHINKGNS